jgi:hypothetical protein
MGDQQISHACDSYSGDGKGAVGWGEGGDVDALCQSGELGEGNEGVVRACPCHSSSGGNR